jgi:hypothetical protein
MDRQELGWTIHNIVGVMIGYQIFGEMFREGLFNTVVIQHDRNAAFWFLFSGFALMLIGALVDWCEKNVGFLPRFLAWSFLAMTVSGAFVMPQSGFWLLFVPTIGLMVRNRKERGE